MLSPHFGLINDYSLGQPPSARDLNRRAQVLDVQLAGALAAQGHGVLTGLTVTEDTEGLSVVVAPGRAFAAHSTHGALFMELLHEFDFSALEDDAENYIFASIRIGSGSSPDTRYDGIPLIVASESSTLDGAVLLAKVTMAGGLVTAVTDLRKMLNSDAFVASWFGNGRRIGSNPATGAPAAVPGSLNLTLPAGSRYYFAGREIVLQNAQTIEVPASATVWPLLSFDEDNLATAEFPALQPASGAGSLGKVVTDDTHVLLVNADFSADLLPDFQALYNLAKVLGSGEGEIDLSGFVKVETYNSLVQRVAALETLLNAGTPTLLNDYERLDSITAGLDISLSEVNPLHPNYMDGSLLSDGLTGNGENRPPDEAQPNVNAGGNEPRGDA